MTQFKARPTVYKGIQMRSRLEAGFAAWLDEWNFRWEYEPCAFATEEGQYLPDFRLRQVPCSWINEPATVYVEVKPKNWPFWNEQEDDIDQHERLMRSMAVIWESEPGAVLLLAQPVDPVLKSEDGFNACHVGILDVAASPGDANPYPWPVLVLWVKGSGGGVGLAKVLPHQDGPWPDGYWKVGR